MACPEVVFQLACAESSAQFLGRSAAGAVRALAEALQSCLSELVPGCRAGVLRVSGLAAALGDFLQFWLLGPAGRFAGEFAKLQLDLIDAKVTLLFL